MDPKNSAQDVLRCNLCEKPVPPYFCELCDIDLCPDCAGKHLVDESKEHKVMPIKKRWSDYPKCFTHQSFHCQLYCELCDVPVCVRCVCLVKHRGHAFCDIIQKHKCIKKGLQEELQELEKTIYPLYQNAASNITNLRYNLFEKVKEMTRKLEKQGTKWHMEIDKIVERMKSEIAEKSAESLAEISLHECKINETMTEISQSIIHLREFVDSSNIFLVLTNISKPAKFGRLPPNIKITLPNFSPKTLNTENLEKRFGSLSVFSMSTAECGGTQL